MNRIGLRELRGVRQLTDAELAGTAGGLTTLQWLLIGAAVYGAGTYLWNKASKKGTDNALKKLRDVDSRLRARTPVYASASRPKATISYLD